MKKIFFTLLTFTLLCMQTVRASQEITLKFTRSGTTSQDITVGITDGENNAINGVTATAVVSHNMKATANNITNEIICPDINANTSPTIEFTFTIENIPQGFSFNTIGMNIHALNGSSTYQSNNDGKNRLFNIETRQGNTTDAISEFGSLSDIDIAAGVGSNGAVHKVWQITGKEPVVCNNSLVIKLTVTKGSDNSGCFFGLSEIILKNEAIEPEPEQPTLPDVTDGKIYNITWKNTGTNYMTEGDYNSIFIDSYNVTKRQFWQLIPTDKENCYYIRNTATGNYIGSCNKTPSSASRISTTSTPTEYYIAATSATSGEIAGCHYFSSTDCSNYDSEEAGPKALNKDGASNFIITWQAGTSRVGSYWKLIETTDLYEIRPFESSNTLGNISTIYMLESLSGQSLTLSDANIGLSDTDQFDENQLWYFAGTNNKEGWQIASVAKPVTTIGISNNEITALEQLETRWIVKESKNEIGYFYFTTPDNLNTLIVGSDSLFKFKKQRSSYARKNQIYNNPCGITGNNHISNLKIEGEDVLNTLSYQSAQKPSKWHIIHTADVCEVTKGKSFDLDITLANKPVEELEVHTYFDWNCDGVFETSMQLIPSGNKCSAEISVPEWASEKKARMRIRVNNSGLNYAEDDVEGFVYDFTIQASAPQEGRTVTVGINAQGRGDVTLSDEAERHTYGTTITATAKANGNSKFICWREGDVIVSTNAEYTFTVDHNIALTAYFSPDTSGSDSPTSADEIKEETSITLQQTDSKIVVTCPQKITRLTIYTANAAIASESNNAEINISHLCKGIYILRVETTDGYKNIKFTINK